MRILLILLLSIIACASTLTGVLLIVEPTGEMLQLPQLIHAKPFHNYLIPGILLVALVGGVSWKSVFINLTNNSKRFNWAMATGTISCIWIVIQSFTIPNLYWTHFIFLAISVMILLITYQQKGKWLL
jgi:hypothetical protein